MDAHDACLLRAALVASLVASACGAVSVDFDPNAPSYLETMARELPASPDAFEVVAATASPDWRRLEGWSLGGVRIDQHDRLSGTDEGLFTWGRLRGAVDVDVACQRRMLGERDPSKDDTSPASDAWAGATAVTICFVGDAVLVLGGRAPWGSRAGLWIGSISFDVMAHRVPLSNVFSFNPERALLYEHDGGALRATVDAHGAALAPDLDASARQEVLLLGAVLQIAQPYHNSGYPPGATASPWPRSEAPSAWLEGVSTSSDVPAPGAIG